MEDLVPTADAFRKVFGCSPQVVVRAPGRVNLIGEHTDYNDGLVLPFAIEQCVKVAASATGDNVAEAFSERMSETICFSIEDVTRNPQGGWDNYLRGVIAALRGEGVAVPGMHLWIGGDLPDGCGLASSAALCVAVALAAIELAGSRMSPRRVARLAQQAERDYAGTACGIMDQWVTQIARPRCGVMIDCRDLHYRYVPLDLNGSSLVLVDSGVRHALAESPYADRVDECRRAVEAIRAIDPAVSSLRDVSYDWLADHGAQLDRVLAKRARHVVSENRRVLRVRDALTAGRDDVVGRILTEGHRSLSEDYAVSCPPIEALVALLAARPGVLGARMTGGGFGGAVIAVVRDESVENLQQAVARDYGRRFSLVTSVRRVAPAAGTLCVRL